MKNTNSKKQAKFYCESCGAEVKQNARVCTNCGKFFSSVRCPRCGKTGTNDDFKKGCPSCGYAVIPGKNLNYSNSNQEISDSFQKQHFYIKHFTKKNNRNNSESLPLWVYIVCISTLVCVVFGVYSCL